MKLNNFVHFQIELDDGLPQYICHHCIILVNGSLKLRQQSALSEATLLESGYKHTLKSKDASYENNDYCSDYALNSPDIKKEENDEKLESNVEVKNSVANSDDKRTYYCRNTPINRMVTVSDNTYKVKVEIGNVVWESEIKKEKTSFEENKVKNNNSKKNNCKTRKSARINKKHKHVKFNKGTDQSKVPEKIIDDNEIGLFDHLLLTKRRTMTKEKLESYTALAVTPYDKKGPVKCKLCHKVLMNFRNFLNHCKIHFAAENTCEVSAIII